MQAKKRQWRAEDLALPQLKKERPQILQQIVQDMKRDGFRGTTDEAAMEHSKRAMPIVRPATLSEVTRMLTVFADENSPKGAVPTIRLLSEHDDGHCTHHAAARVRTELPRRFASLCRAHSSRHRIVPDTYIPGSL